MTAVPTIQVELDGNVVESVTIADLSISYGRQSVLEQPAPSALSCSLTTANGIVVPKVGMTIEVRATVATSPTPTQYVRFAGLVTSVTAGKYTTGITATSAGLGRLARVNATADFRYPGGMGVGEAIFTLLNSYGALKDSFQTLSYMAGETAPLAGLVIPASNLLAMAQALANLDTQGILYETPASDLVFVDATARPFPDLSTPTITFPVANPFSYGDSPIVDDWQAVQSLDGLINSASVTYGNPSATVTVTDVESINTWGVYGYSEDFPVTDVDDAFRRAGRLVAGFSSPRTATNPINVELGSMSIARQVLMMDAEVGTSVGWLPGASSSGIPGLPENTFIEGWTERITGQGGEFGRHSFALYLSDVVLTRAMQRWNQVTALKKWADVSALTTWYELTGISL